MMVGANYSQPVVVDGYACWNCHQVAEAKKGVNPADPPPPGASPTPAVIFGGSLAGLNGASQPGSAAADAPSNDSSGSTLDLVA